MIIWMKQLFLKLVLLLLNKIESSAAMFTSPKKKNMKHRRRLVDVERHEKKRKRTTIKGIEKIQNEIKMDQIQPYGNLV